MISHAPPWYECPFCRNLRGEAEHPLEIVHRDADVFVKVNPRWAPANPGALLVVPVAHHESVYDLPEALAGPVHRAVRASALALKRAFGCDGVSVHQQNEPAGGQTVWHHHVHVVPRWDGDGFPRVQKELAPEGELRRRADLLRAAWPEI